MKLRNETRLPSKLLREIVNFSCPSGVMDFLIRFTYGQYHSGKALAPLYGHFIETKKHDHGFRAYFEKAHGECTDVLIKIPHYVRGRRKIENIRLAHKGYLPCTQYTREEAIVQLVAHELRHLYQALHATRQRGRAWGARGQFSERDAGAYGISRVRHWRRRGSPFSNLDGSLIQTRNT